MSFSAGEIHVICPSCGAPVTVPVHVAQVAVGQGSLVVYLQNSSAAHTCQKIVTA